ncbi:70 kDa peptidyl-prolyl isomerase-like [Spinacia oleracea]|uniref:70 kDa peptidyl-prolyl isomerase-like n=1 Tax=Spinacia oleracea TaxID=3562 RepID=A0ABM3RPJ9_SPIOL|nr:70 kDa peptidyl-prolyl isomerase-like [Spinacia oleracea]
MKEEGNLLFKKGHIIDSLEKYGYAGIILGCFIFEEEEHLRKFYDLSICILLNSAVCFSRKIEYEQVGLICSVILEFDSNNVKDLYRRAMAAGELCRGDFAFLDLLLAS